MIKEVTIKNYKSVFSAFLELGKVNVFVGPNGAGKSNLLEAIAMLSAESDGVVRVDDLAGKGVRVVKPGLTVGSFYGKQSSRVIEASLCGDIKGKLFNKIYRFVCNDWEEADSDWLNDYKYHPLMNMEHFIRNSALLGGALRTSHPDLIAGSMDDYNESLGKFKTLQRTFGGEKEKVSSSNYFEISRKHLTEFLIYSPFVSALQGKVRLSKKTPLGLHGEGLAALIASFSEEKSTHLLEIACRYIEWLKEIIVEEENFSGSQEAGAPTAENAALFFTDRFMLKRNNLLSAADIDEVSLRILFYLSLFLSEDTPSFFAIDRFDSGLNPVICPKLMKELIRLAKIMGKQVLITADNPASLDGLDIENMDICLFSVVRNSDGQTEVKKIRTTRRNQQADPLSARWLRNDLY